MIEFRQQIKELVTYILNPEERDEDVIENYTDTVMLACEEYHIKQLKLYGVVVNEVEFYCEQEMSLGKGNMCKVMCGYCKELNEK